MSISGASNRDVNSQIQNAALLADQLAQFLTAQMKALKTDQSDDAFSEVRIKTALLISKGIQAMEDLIKRMDQASHEANQYPQDIVEFSKKLEKQIAIIADAGRKKKLPKEAK